MNKAIWLTAFALLPGLATAEPSGKAQHRNTFKENFKQVDSNHDGLLSMAEAEKHAPGLALRFSLIDSNRDGQLSQQEILGFVKRQQQAAVARFKRADKNGNGALSKQEAKQLPGVLAHYDEMDADHNGELTPREIGAYVRAQAKAQARAQPRTPPQARSVGDSK